MSDALTDIARDESRGRCFGSYLLAVKKYLENPTKENMKKAVEAAEYTDSIRGGYWSGETNLSKDVEQKLKKLEKGEPEEWAKFLSVLLRNDHYRLDEFKKISPFKDKFLLYIDYGCGFVAIKGEIEKLVSKIIRENKGWKTYDADDYLITLPIPETKDAEVFWLDCGIMGVKGPRKTEK